MLLTRARRLVPYTRFVLTTRGHLNSASNPSHERPTKLRTISEAHTYRTRSGCDEPLVLARVSPNSDIRQPGRITVLLSFPPPPGGNRRPRLEP